MDSIGVKAVERDGGDDTTNSLCMSISPVMHVSVSPVTHASYSPTQHASPPTALHMAHSLVPHSPSKSPSLRCHSQGSRSSSSSSGSSSGSGSASGSGSLSSSGSGLGNESGTGSPEKSQTPAEGSGSGNSQQSCSASPEVVLVQEDDEDAAGDEEEEGGLGDEEEEDGLDYEETLLQGMVLLLDISNSDNEETRKAAVHEKVCKSDVLYTAWQEEQIYQGNDDIAKCDKRVHDHKDTGRCCKAPDKIGPPLTYMEEHGVFKPLDTIDNLMGLCRFYWMSSKKSKVLTGPKSTESAHKIKDMIKLAKGIRQLLTVVVFEGETVTLLGLLQELHLCLALSCITIQTSEEVKVGPKNHMSCCPICMYVVKNNYSFLNHIIIRHYWSSFSCGKCLNFTASNGQQMKRHILIVGSPRRDTRKGTPKVTRCLKCKVIQNLAISPRR